MISSARHHMVPKTCIGSMLLCDFLVWSTGAGSSGSQGKSSTGHTKGPWQPWHKAYRQGQEVLSAVSTSILLLSSESWPAAPSSTHTLDINGCHTATLILLYSQQLQTSKSFIRNLHSQHMEVAGHFERRHPWHRCVIELPPTALHCSDKPPWIVGCFLRASSLQLSWDWSRRNPPRLCDVSHIIHIAIIFDTVYRTSCSHPKILTGDTDLSQIEPFETAGSIPKNRHRDDAFLQQVACLPNSPFQNSLSKACFLSELLHIFCTWWPEGRDWSLVVTVFF